MATFRARFDARAGSVRRRLFSRQVLTGLAAGLVGGAASAWLGWTFHLPELRLYGPVALTVVGVGAGIGMGMRTRWSNRDVAMYLDRGLGGEESISTALEFEEASLEGSDAARAVVVSKAEDVLSKPSPKHSLPMLFKRAHMLAPLGALLVGLSFRIPERPIPVPKADRAIVTLQQVSGIEDLAKLAAMNARDAEQKKRLEKLAKNAKSLSEDLKKGIEQREAQSRIAELRDALREERYSLSNEEREGLDHAAQALEGEGATKSAGKALADNDLSGFDDEMEKLANSREKADRDLAKKKLEEAKEAAKKNGGKKTEKALQESKEKFAAREKRAEMLRELGEAMKDSGLGTPETSRGMENLNREKSDAAARSLSEAMGKALEKLSPEERKRLAEKMKELAKKEAQENGGGMNSGSGAQDLAQDLATPE
nr:hypothetical protein [Polyangiaceae bacterium]